MKLPLACALTSASFCIPSYAASVWCEGDILALRTEGVGGDANFVGDPPSNVDADNNGVIDDGSTEIQTTINIDSEGSSPYNLAGDNFNYSLTYQFYDADGIFSFTENFDDGVQVDVQPIVSNLDQTANGAAGAQHSDMVWNGRTYANYDFSATSGAGWYSIEMNLDEIGGGAQSAGGIGFGFFNGNSTTVGDFGGIGYAAGAGQVAFDVDPATGAAFGSLKIPEPTSGILGLFGLTLILRRRR